MKKLQVLRERNCADCGQKFFTLYGNYCETCRRKRRQKKPMEYRECPVCKLKKHMFMGQIICRDCTFAMINKRESEPRGIIFVEQRRKDRKTGGKLFKFEDCPNFDKESVNCQMCEPGSWKFKDCGQK